MGIFTGCWHRCFPVGALSGTYLEAGSGRACFLRNLGRSIRRPDTAGSAKGARLGNRSGLPTFFYDCLGFHKEDFAAVPQWILWRGLVSQRLATYPTGYFSRFAKQLVESRKEQTKLSDIAPFMKSARTPVLLVLGERDACVNVNKCAQIERQFGNEYCTKVVVKDHGHLGGPKRIGNYGMHRNLWTESAKLSAQFLWVFYNSLK